MVSAGLYFAYLWPQVEPEEPAAGSAPETAKPEADEAADEPAADAPEEQPSKPA